MLGGVYAFVSRERGARQRKREREEAAREEHARAQRERILRLFDQFMSPRVSVARHQLWTVSRAWAAGDRGALEYFLLGAEPVSDEGPLCQNGLTPYQNLSFMLSFFVSLQMYIEKDLVDQDLARQLFQRFFAWYQRFLSDFVEAYLECRSRDNGPLPFWVVAIPKLKLFMNEGLSGRSIEPAEASPGYDRHRVHFDA